MPNASARVGSVMLTTIGVRCAIALVVVAAPTFAPRCQAQQAYAGGLEARSLVTQPIDEKRLVERARRRVAQRPPAQGYPRDDVEGAEPRVGAGVAAQVQ